MQANYDYTTSPRCRHIAVIYQRLTMRTCARYSALICPIVTLISGLVLFSRLLGDTAAGNIPAFILGKLFVLTLLKYAPQLLILSVFAGTLVAMRRAFVHNEMAAWLGSGLALHDFIKPLLLLALPAAAAVGAFSLYASPWAVHQINLARTAASFNIDIDALPLQQFGDVPGKTHSYFRQGEAALFIASNVRDEVIFASGLQREGETALQLLDGNLFYLSAQEDGSNALDKMHFGEMRVALPVVQPGRLRPRAKPLTALVWENSSERGELIWRLALPLAMVVLTLAALFLSPTHSRRGRRFGLLVAMTVFFLYLNGLRFVRDQVENETLPALLGLLAPPLLLGLLVVGLMRLLRQ